MRGNGWMQRMLYFLILMLGVYIVYKGGSLFMRQPAVQTVLDGGEVQRKLENAAARTWTGGYAAVLERKDRNWFGSWFRAALPVYSYLVEHGEMETKESETEQKDQSADRSGERAAEDKIEREANAKGAKNILSAAENGEDGEALKEEGADEETGGETESDKNNNGEKQPEYSTEEYEEETETLSESESTREVLGRTISQDLLLQLSDFNYLVNEYFTVDGGTVADADLLDAASFLSEDLSIVKNQAVPQILIYHTHSQEEFADSVEGDAGTTIVGMGDVLADALEAKGYQVIHDTGVYDLVDGVLDRSAAYDYARTAVEELLTQYPTIQVVIDLHRDGVEGQKFVTEIDGKPCSKVMFFNGISRNQQGEISYLPNPYIKQNLAFSFQMEFAARQQYPGFTRNIYLKAERFNLHLRPRSVLIEAGTQLNTVEEERNAMEILANLLDEVLQQH
ncbi:MAG: stage II sporulation protein P [Lachnospiraceae bacterium]